MQWVLGSGCYVKHSPPSGAEVKNENFTFLHYNVSALKFVNVRNIDNGLLVVTVIVLSRIAKFHALCICITRYILIMYGLAYGRVYDRFTA